MARRSPAAAAAAPSDACTTIWLGVPGELVGAAEVDQLDHYCTRVGGSPVFPGSAVPPLPPSPASATGNTSSSAADAAAAPPRCSVCGAALSLVLQAYAPLPQLPDRVLMVFGCTAQGCGRTADCWQALRCQLAAAPPEPHQQQQQQGSVESSAAADGAATAAAAAGTGFDSLDAGFDDWGAGDFATPGAGAGATAADTFDFSALTASLAATAKQQQAHQQQQQKLKQQGGGKHKQQQPHQAPGELGDGQQAAAGSCKGVAGPQLPEYYVVSEVEPDAATSKAISSRELQHVQQLLAAYEEAAAAAEPLAAASTSGSGGHRQAPAAAAEAAAAGAGEGEAGASWAGEEYEPDSVSCMERAYVKFMKRLARAPQQCVRYCHGGRLLWPQKQAPAPSPCPRCGGARVFELQLMPPLLAMTLEAADMAREQGLPLNAAVVNAVANWDWCTITVFTCAGSCSSSPAPDGSCGVAVEQVLLVREAECEVAHQPGNSLTGGGGAADEADGEEQED